MFYAIIDSASLKNPTILNDFKPRKITVSYEPESKTAKYHYNFLLEFKNDKIMTVIPKIQKEMLLSWYTFFWDENILYIVFKTRKFQIDLLNGWTSEEYKTAQKFGKTQNIPDDYLDFKKYFKPTKEISK